MKRDAEAVQTHLNRGSCSLGNPVDSTTVARVLDGLGHPELGVWGRQHTSEFEEHRAAPHSHGGLLRSRQDSHRSAGRESHGTHSHPHSICPSPPHLWYCPRAKMKVQLDCFPPSLATST